MYSSNSFLPDSMLIGAANESIENAENHFNNQNYVDCVIEVTRAENFLFFRDNPPPIIFRNNFSASRRGINVMTACGLPLDELYRFESNLYSVASRFGDGYVLIRRNPQADSLINRETAEFLLNFVKELASRIEGLQ